MEISLDDATEAEILRLQLDDLDNILGRDHIAGQDEATNDAQLAASMYRQQLQEQNSMLFDRCIARDIVLGAEAEMDILPEANMNILAVPRDGTNCPRDVFAQHLEVDRHSPANPDVSSPALPELEEERVETLPAHDHSSSGPPSLASPTPRGVSDNNVDNDHLNCSRDEIGRVPLVPEYASSPTTSVGTSTAFFSASSEIASTASEIPETEDCSSASKE